MSVNSAALFLGAMVLGGICPAMEQELQVGIIDFYGLGKIPESEARQALTISEGAMVRFGARPAFIEDSKRRLSALPPSRAPGRTDAATSMRG